MPGPNRIGLNEAQKRAVTHGSGNATCGPLLIIAGAGSGKTNTLAHRVAHLVSEGTDPARVLLLTFSRRAAQELERRAGRVLAGSRKRPALDRPPTFPWAGTFHGIGARILREYAERLGLAPNFTIHDRGDSEDLMALVRHAHVVDDATNARFPGAATCLAIYSRVVNAESALTNVLSDRYPWCAAHSERLRGLFDAYVAAKQAQQILDFDDLLIYWAAMMRVPAFAAEVGALFDHVMIDEYQDTNTIQAAILRLLKPDGRGVTVVGDDAQAIYSFRAATVRNILDFPGQYAPPATVITLERNYRSTAAILDASNAVISLAKERYTKNLVTDRGHGERPGLVTVADESVQAEFAAEQVLVYRENGVSLREQAVLFRTSSHSAQLELELSRRNIPFVKFGGLRFLEAAHIKDLLSVLRWIENPRGRLAGFRALRLVPGVGPATAARWLDALDTASDSVSAMRSFKAPSSAGRGLAVAHRAVRATQCVEWRLARGVRGTRWLVHAATRTPLRRCFDAINGPCTASEHRRVVPQSGAIPDRPDSRPAIRDERGGGPATTRRRILDAFDHSLRERSGVEGCAGAQLHRWLHALRHGDGKFRRHRGGATAALCGNDARAGRPHIVVTTTVLCASTASVRRSARICDAQSLPHR